MSFVGYVIHEKSVEEIREAFQKRERRFRTYTDRQETEETHLSERVWQDIRRKKMLACADIVLGGWKGKEYVIVALLRSSNESYPNTYCMIGGNMQGNTVSTEEFLKEKVKKETNINLPENTVMCYIGTYITRCRETGITTMQVCFFSRVSEEWLIMFENQKERSKEIEEHKLFSKSEWQSTKEEHKFWYQDRVFNLIWNVMEQ